MRHALSAAFMSAISAPTNATHQTPLLRSRSRLSFFLNLPHQPTKLTKRDGTDRGCAA